MKPEVFIDGSEGTTGLQILQRLSGREDITLLTLPGEHRKDTEKRREMMRRADLVILCLPDEAAREAVGLIENEKTRVIDASTAHRTAPGWVYGFPELHKEQREAIRSARLVANPGCHAVGFISIVHPLVALGILPKDYPVTCFSLTGYTGGGKKMIAQYEQEKTPDLMVPRLYGLNLKHKHLPEMTKISGLAREPVFVPVVDDYDCGMATTILLHNDGLAPGTTAGTIHEALSDYYAGETFVKVAPKLGEGYLGSGWGRGTNFMEITVSGNEAMTAVTSRFDNLGKGASGSAVQNMNIMLGLPETAGLI